MSHTVLVTGGAGFVGSYVVRGLVEAGANVVVYDLAQPTGQMAYLLRDVRERVVYERGQILDLPSLLAVARRHHVDAVFHAAALYDPEYSLANPYITYQVNVEGTLNVLETARLEGIGRVVLSSSIAVYPDKRYEPLDEAHPISSISGGHPLGHYGSSKAAAELAGLTYYTHNQVDFVALRFSAVYGFGMRYPMYVKPMVENSLQGQASVFATGAPMPRDYTHVKDIAQAVVKAVSAPADALRQRVFLVGSGEVRTAGDVAAVVRGLVPGARIEIGAGLTDLERGDAAARGMLDLSATRQQIGYAPVFNLERGVADYVDSFKGWLAASS
ncbi:MAG: NAD-dependent epimerase/dehydratase family protein, partial [Chloroflexota bacterium]